MFKILTGCTPGSGILHYAHGDSQQTHLLKQGKNVAFEHTLLLTFLILNIHFLKMCRKKLHVHWSQQWETS